MQQSLVLAGASAVGSYLALEMVEANIPSQVPGDAKVKRSLAVGVVVLAADQLVKRF